MDKTTIIFHRTISSITGDAIWHNDKIGCHKVYAVGEDQLKWPPLDTPDTVIAFIMTANSGFTNYGQKKLTPQIIPVNEAVANRQSFA